MGHYMTVKVTCHFANVSNVLSLFQHLRYVLMSKQQNVHSCFIVFYLILLIHISFGLRQVIVFVHVVLVEPRQQVNLILPVLNRCIHLNL